MIRINGTEYEASIVSAMDGSMRIKFGNNGMALSDIDAVFTDSAKIEVIENGEIAGIYYNRAVKSISFSGKGEGRTISVYLDATELSAAAEAALTAEVETTSTALSDLAEVVSTNSETADTNSDALAELAETVSALAERVTALEEAANG